jgi:hypothetical protein
MAPETEAVQRGKARWVGGRENLTHRSQA